jgi:hypothetical protein
MPAVSLKPLSRPEARRLLVQLAFPSDLRKAELKRILDAARGSPKLLHRAARAHARGEFDPGDLFREDVERQDDVGLRLLRFLSLFARPVTVAELSRAAGLGTRRAADALRDMANLVCAEGRSTFYLASDSLRREIAESIDAREAKAMHLACARAVERRSPRGADAPFHADLVRHFALGGEVGKAGSFLERAVEALAANGNAARACALVYMVFEREAAKRNRVALAVRLSDLARQSGQNDLARKALAEVLPGCRGPETCGSSRRCWCAPSWRAAGANRSRSSWSNAHCPRRPRRARSRRSSWTETTWGR